MSYVTRFCCTVMVQIKIFIWSYLDIVTVIQPGVLPVSVAVDIAGPSHQDNYHGSKGLALPIKVVVTKGLELCFGVEQLL